MDTALISSFTHPLKLRLSLKPREMTGLVCALNLMTHGSVSATSAYCPFIRCTDSPQLTAASNHQWVHRRMLLRAKRAWQ